MIGQQHLMFMIEEQIRLNKFPRFSIIVGPEGSGKRLVAEKIGSLLNATKVPTGTMVNNIREMIDMAYQTVSPLAFIIADADAMSVGAKNALLKVTEEPPHNAYFILLLTDTNNTLPTIRSRGAIYFMDNYTTEEIIKYYRDKAGTVGTDEEKIVADICCTPGDVETLLTLDIQAFNAFVKQVLNYIATASLANALKISTNIQLKEGSEAKYPLTLFWRAFENECLLETRRLMEEDKSTLHLLNAIKVTSQFMQELRVLGINKQSLFDAWVIEVRKALSDGYSNP